MISRKTNPRGNPVVPRESWDDDVTRPGMDEFELLEMRRKRSRKISEAYDFSKTAARDIEELSKKVANVSLEHASMRNDIAEIKTGQIGITHLAEQIFSAVRKRDEEDKDARKLATTEGGAWKRTLAQLLITTGAVAVAIVSLAISKC